MPRQPRLDAPGLLQHVMARGIERREIFKDDKDRNSFLQRFAIILDETQTQCYAWSLIPNHFHLLIRTGATPLSKIMRRLMTGHAVTFNRRHKRSGHLFQNRYKSVVCEEDSYLLELIRYIHLNPLRAKLVQDLKELDKYPWTGHSTILGRCKNPLIPDLPNQGKRKFAIPNPKSEMNLADRTIQDVLLYFDEAKKVARWRYRDFVKKGISQGTREDLQGGGLVRSAGGERAGLLGRKAEEREKGDARILGSGNFVSTILSDSAGTALRARRRISLDLLSKKVASHFEVEEADLKSSNKKKSVVDAKAIFGYLAMKKMGYSGREVGTFLNMRSYSAIRRAQEGKKVIDNRGFMWDISRIVE